MRGLLERLGLLQADPEGPHQCRFVPIRRGYPQRICKCGAMKVGRNSISQSPGGVDVQRWSGTQAAVQLGDLGMDVSTGFPSVFVAGAAAPLKYTQVAEINTVNGWTTADFTGLSGDFNYLLQGWWVADLQAASLRIGVNGATGGFTAPLVNLATVPSIIASRIEIGDDDGSHFQLQILGYEQTGVANINKWYIAEALRPGGGGSGLNIISYGQLGVLGDTAISSINIVSALASRPSRFRLYRW